MGLIEVVRIGRDIVQISHPQYADDTIFVCPSKLQFAYSLKYILRNFEIIFGLKVNFNKCSIVGINVEQNLAGCTAEVLMCEVAKLHLSYLSYM